MFGSKIKLGLKTSYLPKESIRQVQTEEELETLIQEIHIGSSSHDEVCKKDLFPIKS